MTSKTPTPETTLCRPGHERCAVDGIECECEQIERSKQSGDLCQCPTCGRMHKSLGFGKPPEAISGASLLRAPELLGQPARLCDDIARSLFGPQNRVWDARWQALHEHGLQFTAWSGPNDPTEGKGFYWAQAQIALKVIKDRLDLRLNNHLVDMREGYDDSIVGFNEAWDIMRSIFEETRDV